MRRYHAVVIDGKRLIKYGIETMVFVLFAAVSILSIKVTENIDLFGKENVAKRIIDESVPTISSTTGAQGGFMNEISQTLKKCKNFFLTFNPEEKKSIIMGEIPLIKVASGSYLAMRTNGAVEVYNPQNADLGEGSSDPMTGDEGEYPIKEIDSSQNKLLGDAKTKILIRNDTGYGINVDEMLKDSLKFNMNGPGAKVLILHTHATESYTPEGATLYSTEKSDRSLSLNENVVRIGKIFKQIFEEKGIATIHDTTLHDYPNFNGSYSNALKTIEKHKSKNPGIEIVIDIHRDAFIYDDGAKAKFVTEIDGKKTAQLMLVVGTNAGGLEHPNWRENMKFALQLQNNILKKYPTLMRGVNLRKERFNGQTTKGSLIIEVGSSGNTMTEAINAATISAGEIAEFLNSLK